MGADNPFVMPAGAPRYVCHKEVRAAKIAEVEMHHQNGDVTLRFADREIGPVRVVADWVNRHKPQEGGYLVVYKDGYTSYSPAEAFEDGYTRIHKADMPYPDNVHATRRWFHYAHLPEPLRSVSRMFHVLAERLDKTFPDSAEKSAGPPEVARKRRIVSCGAPGRKSGANPSRNRLTERGTRNEGSTRSTDSGGRDRIRPDLDGGAASLRSRPTCSAAGPSARRRCGGGLRHRARGLRSRTRRSTRRSGRPAPTAAIRRSGVKPFSESPSSSPRR